MQVNRRHASSSGPEGAAQPALTLLAATSSASIASHAATTAVVTVEELAPGALACSRASFFRASAAMLRLTAVGRLQGVLHWQAEGWPACRS
jgi:hypothetical protein